MLDVLLTKKDKLLNERDLCAELYNLWISRLHDVQDNEEEYEMYKNMIENLEPYTQKLKEEVRILNREICKFEGVDSIAQTNHSRDCTYKYGHDRPNK